MAKSGRRKGGGKKKGARRDEAARRRAAPQTRSAPATPERLPEPRPQPVADVNVIATEASAAGLPLIAGIGASAGGLEACSQLLHSLPAKPGLALVVVQHLAPHHESSLPALLAGQTGLPVLQAEDRMAIEVDHVYVIPPNVQMRIEDGRIHLSERPSDRSQYTPIDGFLRSLADAAQDRAIAVVLSGTASDGTAGVRDVKAVGGITIAQRPETARYDGMPRAAIASGLVDLVLSPQEIAAELVRLAQQTGELLPAPDPDRVEVPRVVPPEPAFERIFTLLRVATNVDFKRYKMPTIYRRIQRRMLLHKLNKPEHYVRFLEEDKGELRALYDDILIHVTRFFREPESFGALVDEVFPQITAARDEDRPIRIWVSGCATGEEAYSVAMVLLEFLGERGNGIPIQLFATDVSNTAIEHARNGIYPESITADVSPERLRHFFTKSDGGGYRVAKGVRDVCVFARQDLTRDPPFSKLDLVLCRNVLIYLGTDLQNRLMSVFHYALRPTGFLMLGHAETIGTHTDLFATVDKKHRIYRRRSATSSALSFSVDYTALPSPIGKRPPAVPDPARSVQNEASRLIQDRYAPPGVIVDGDFQVVQFRGQTGAYLEPAPGDPNLSVLKLAREGLLYGLRTALYEARKTERTARKLGLRVKENGSWRKINIEAVPMLTGDQRHFLVMFHDVSPDDGSHARKAKRGVSERRRDPRDGNLARLQEELASSREYLQSIIQDLEAANEELQSANEEILSSNEELQSTNEELDTAKEELQSTNEELNTVNEELNARNDELSRVNSDLVNLLSSVQIAIVIVARDLRIRRFTPMAERVLNLIPTDIGRPISHLKPNIDCPDLEEFITNVIDTVTPREREVRDSQGNWLSLRVRPYKNVDNRIDGAVLTLFDIDGDKRPSDERRQAGDQAEMILRIVRQPLLLLDEQFRVQRANRAFHEHFGLTDGDLSQRVVYELDQGRWDIPRLHDLLERDLASRSSASDVEIVQSFGNGQRRLVVGAQRLEAADGRSRRILLAIHDRTAEEEGT
jgi:two-component system CheB/CheR fusion protein